MRTRDALTQARPCPDLVEAATRAVAILASICGDWRDGKGEDWGDDLLSLGHITTELRAALMSTNPPSIDTSGGNVEGLDTIQEEGE
jgi:hypothetical protein